VPSFIRLLFRLSFYSQNKSQTVETVSNSRVSSDVMAAARTLILVEVNPILAKPRSFPYMLEQK